MDSVVQCRPLRADDYDVLADSLALDTHHEGTSPMFFVEPGTLAAVYEDEHGPILFSRATKSLRLDLQFVNNADVRRNMAAMLDGFPNLVSQAKANGFTELVFCTSTPLLQRFCEKRLGFVAVDGTELRRLL